eukprot:TRINITY_DN34940_c0_g1_i1.p1 TRINITY_DN34940_c0_g1~~TRINITY_DN34940_c0_g1_i1.p1  ORF type:complete len:280 (+),score=-12.98 TRINITY_DN34940_c0_g1_i1:97-840(+)
MAKNCAVYGLPGLLSLLVFTLGIPTNPAASMASFLLGPVTGLVPGSAIGSATAGLAAAAASAAASSAVGYSGSSAWWLCLIVGAVHLQFERARAVHMQESKETLRAFGRGLKRTREQSKRQGQRAEKQGRVSSPVGGGREEQGEEEGRVWGESEERRRLREFDARLMRQGVKELGPPATWTTQGVATWLQAEEFGDYVDAFLEHSVDGEVLLALTADDLKNELGVRNLGQRKRLLAALGRLRDWFMP